MINEFKKQNYENSFVSIQENTIKKKVIEQITITECLERIKNGAYFDQVNKARSIGKLTNKTEYDKVKVKIPSWTPHGLFQGSREDKNLENLTGFYYLDIDGQECTPEMLKQYEFIYAFWKSLSGLGYGMLVKCKNLSTDNFAKTWIELEKIFLNRHGLQLDRNAKGLSRQNIFSYDPDLFVNQDCTPYIYTDPDLSIIVHEPPKVNLYSIDFNEVDIYSQHRTLSGLTFKTILSDIDKEDAIRKSDYYIIPDGKEARHCYLPKNIPEGKRHRLLKGYIKSILFNNPRIKKENLSKLMIKINATKCKPPLPDQEIINIVDWLYGLHHDSKLNYNTKLKRIWFDEDSLLTANEKKSLAAKENANIRRTRSFNLVKKIYESILNLFPSIKKHKISKLIVTNSGLSKTQVNKYLKELKK